MRKLLLIIVLLACGSYASLRANIAMPGFFNVGGSSEFQLLFPEDSMHLDKISMNREWVSVQLYNGFAVVKGEYEMQNLSDEAITMNVGYPLNSLYEGNDANTYIVEVDTLHAIKVLVNGIPAYVIKVNTQKEEGVDPYETHRNWEKLAARAANWQVWETTFAPATTTTITVYFMVRTHNAMVLQGYDKAYPNGFAYLLESGKPWAGTIGKGRVMVQHKAEKPDWQGLLPAKRFKLSPDGSALVWDFTDLEPSRRDNVVVRYGERPFPFNIGPHLAKSEDYFKTIDQSPIKVTQPKDWEAANFPDMFEVKKLVSGGLLVGGLMFLVIYGLPMLGILLVVLLGIWLYRRNTKTT